MENESILQNHGENDNQWYETYPERLNEEIRLVKECYPDFIFSGLKEKENVSWQGKVKCFYENGKELCSLDIKIECERNYPIIFPKVYDINGELSSKKCPHLNGKDKSICYGNRLDSQLNFLKDTRIKDVIDFVGIFIARQWHFEKTGEWPGEQMHAESAFLYHEIKHGTISLSELCPCGMTSLDYLHCHFPKVKVLLSEIDKRYSEKLKNVKIKIGRNEKCPCGSNKKSKKCCFGNLNFADSKCFLIARYPCLAEGIRVQNNKGYLTIS